RFGFRGTVGWQLGARSIFGAAVDPSQFFLKLRFPESGPVRPGILQKRYVFLPRSGRVADPSPSRRQVHDLVRESSNEFRAADLGCAQTGDNVRRRLASEVVKRASEPFVPQTVLENRICPAGEIEVLNEKLPV